MVRLLLCPHFHVPCLFWISATCAEEITVELDTPNVPVGSEYQDGSTSYQRSPEILDEAEDYQNEACESDSARGKCSSCLGDGDRSYELWSDPSRSEILPAYNAVSHWPEICVVPMIFSEKKHPRGPWCWERGILERMEEMGSCSFITFNLNNSFTLHRERTLSCSVSLLADTEIDRSPPEGQQEELVTTAVMPTIFISCSRSLFSWKHVWFLSCVDYGEGVR